MVGVARRNWARCEHSMETVAAYNRDYGEENSITMPYIADDRLINKLVDEYSDGGKNG